MFFGTFAPSSVKFGAISEVLIARSAKKICNLGPSGTYSPPFAPTSSLRPLRKGPPLTIFGPPPKSTTEGARPLPVSATGGPGPPEPPLYPPLVVGPGRFKSSSVSGVRSERSERPAYHQNG